MSIEELVGTPRSEFEFVAAEKVQQRKRQDAILRPLVPEAGDMLIFRGDQRHSYRNPDNHRPCVAISVICFAS